MAPTTDYKIIMEPTPNALTDKVKAALAEGWQVYGGLVTMNNSWAQALVKTQDLMAQMNTKLASIVSNTSSIASNTSATASNTSAIKSSTASIDSKTPAA